MVNARYERLQHLFDAALTLPPDSRDQFLDSHCDDELRRDLEALLQVHEHEDDYLEPGEGSHAFDHLQSAWSPDTPVPTRVGRYRIVGVAGQGGMGTVYEADQDSPRRRVALKLIRSVGVSQGLLRRFERESDILARLKHPNIAQVYDAGSTEVFYDGDISGGTAPYFALELICGSPIDQYVADHELPVSARLELFARVCDAVHYAHQNAVIHRDLKPKNILIDDRGEPKIVDFGIARATDASDGTVQTEVGQIVGTLPYMSPEQVSGDPSAVDARSDIYSLGVVLYELLAGTLPYDVSSSSVPEVTRIIVDSEPKLLGTVSRDYRGDLETIVNRALQKQPEARYASAAALGADVERHLRREPIEARRDSILYLAHRRMRRYRGVIGLGLVAIIALGALGTYAWMQALSYSQLAIQESDAKQDALESEKKAADARQEAIRQRDEARAATEFLMDVVGMADPDLTHQMDSARLAMLRDVADEVDQRFANQPQAEAMIRTGLGRVFFANGHLHEAETQLRRALLIREADVTSTAQEQFDVLWPYMHVLYDVDDKSPYHHMRKAWWALGDVLTERYPELHEHLKSAYYPNCNIEAAREIVEGSWDDEPIVAELYADYCHVSGLKVASLHHPDRARPWLEEALSYYLRIYPATNTRVARCRIVLTEELLDLEEYELALELADVAAASVSTLVPPDHWYLATCTARRGAALAGLGRHAEGEQALLNGLRGVCESLGEHVKVATSIRTHLVTLYEATGQVDAAREMRHAIARSMGARRQRHHWLKDFKVVFGPEDSEIVATIESIHKSAAGPAETLSPQVDKLLQLRREHYPDDHVMSGVIADLLMLWVDTRANRHGIDALARRMVDESMRIGHAQSERYPSHLASSYLGLAWCCLAESDHNGAEDALREALRLLKPLAETLYGFVGVLHTCLGNLLHEQGRLPEAREQLIAGPRDTNTFVGPEDANTIGSVDSLVRFHLAQGDIDEASTVLADFCLHAKRVGRRAARMHRVCWLPLRRPGLDPAAYRAAREVAQRFAPTTKDPHMTVILAMAEYRLGNYREAIRLCHEALDSGESVTNRTVHAHAILALAHHSLGDRSAATEGRARLDEWKQRPSGVLVELMQEVERTLAD